jgi:hypothetical protein
MSLSSATIKVAPTSVAATGGSDLAFSSLGNLSNGKLTLAALSDTDLRLRRTIDMSVKNPMPSVSGPNGYTQARTSGIFKYPKLLANGKITVATVRVEVAYDVEYTQTEVQQLIDVGAQMLCDPDFTPTFKTLSLV